jgi:hypothetical protein
MDWPYEPIASPPAGTHLGRVLTIAPEIIGKQ